MIDQPILSICFLRCATLSKGTVAPVLFDVQTGTTYDISLSFHSSGRVKRWIVRDSSTCELWHQENISYTLINCCGMVSSALSSIYALIHLFCLGMLFDCFKDPPPLVFHRMYMLSIVSERPTCTSFIIPPLPLLYALVFPNPGMDPFPTPIFPILQQLTSPHLHHPSSTHLAPTLIQSLYTMPSN